MGDIAGIGPELIARVVTDPRMDTLCRPLVVGQPEILARSLALVGRSRIIEAVTGPQAVVGPQDADPYDPPTIRCWDPGDHAQLRDLAEGKTSGLAGRAAYDWLVAAARAALAGQIDAIVTAPLSKAALHAGGVDFPGHTEILAAECGVRESAMMLYVPPGGPILGTAGLAVAHATLHTSIASVPGLLTTARVIETIALVEQFMHGLTGQPPRIGVCALNPHAGEDGLFGDEEVRVIAPAVQAAARQPGTLVSGPYPADTLLRRAAAGEFDAVVAMYHDQGHIALKLLAFDAAVNVTLGLPIVRTSPSQGTAFDIAGRGVARPDGMWAAVVTAVQLVRSRAAKGT